MKRVLLWLLFVSLSPAAYAHEIKFGDLVIVHPMVDEAKKGQPIARGSFEIRNEGSTLDQLLSISSEFADRTTIEGSVPVAVPANSRVPILMKFENIKRKLSEYEAYNGELVFEKAGAVKVDLIVHTHSH
jgi:copper(I)-binding protein